MKAWRISHRAYALMDGSGAATYPGRWNGPDQRAIYRSARDKAQARGRALTEKEWETMRPKKRPPNP